MSFFSSKNSIRSVDNSKSPAKGEPFKYEDFTPEQLESLRGPSGLGDERLDGFMLNIPKLTSSTNRLTSGVTNVSAVDTNTVQYTTNTNYGHVGLTVPNNPSKKYLTAIKVSNVGTVSAGNAKLNLAYSNSQNGTVALNGGTLFTIGTILAGSMAEVVFEFTTNDPAITTDAPFTNAMLGFFTNANGAVIRLTQKVYDITNLSRDEINKIDWKTLEGSTLLKANYADSAKTANNINYKGSAWQGKTWITLGDSITSTGTYQSLVKNALGFGNVLNKGVAGQGMGSMIDNVSIEELQSADLITIYGSLNHMFPNAPTIGSVSDVPVQDSSGTFIAQLKYLIESILTIKPTANLVIIGTHNAADEFRPDIYQPIAGGKNVGDYVLAMGEVARYYGCPFIDMYSKCGFNAFNLMTYTSDGAHPNNLGYQKIASVIVGELQRIELI